MEARFLSVSSSFFNSDFSASSLSAEISMTPSPLSPCCVSSFSFFVSACNLSNALSAAVALSMASFHSESLRWQAEMLDLRTAIS